MTLEEAVEALYGFRDHLVDVTIALTGEVGGEQSLATFSGIPIEVSSLLPIWVTCPYQRFWSSSQ